MACNCSGIYMSSQESCLDLGYLRILGHWSSNSKQGQLRSRILINPAERTNHSLNNPLLSPKHQDRFSLLRNQPCLNQLLLILVLQTRHIPQASRLVGHRNESLLLHRSFSRAEREKIHSCADLLLRRQLDCVRIRKGSDDVGEGRCGGKW